MPIKDDVMPKEWKPARKPAVSVRVNESCPEDY